MRASISMLVAPWLCLCAAAQGAQSAPPSPFAPGQRWSSAADPGAPWIPRDVVFVGAGELLWVAPSGLTPSLQLFASSEFEAPGVSPAALFVDASLGAVTGPIQLAAGDSSAELYALLQVPVSGSNLRQSVVRRYDAQAAARGAGFQPLWSRAFDQNGNGPAALAVCADGSRILAGAFDANSAELRLMYLNASDASSLFELSLPASGLGKLSVSADGQRLCVETGAGFTVLDASGQALFARQAPSASLHPSLSADGALLAAGSVGGLDIYLDSGFGYSLLLSHAAAADELCTALEISADGSGLVAGWWNFTNGTDVRVELFEVSSGRVQNSYVQVGSPSGLQNYPLALAISADGRRVGVGLWGTSDARPEVLLLERDQPQPILSADLEGSVYALALDASGTRLGVALKSTHANLLSALGRVALFDSGERDLQLMGAVRLGGSATARYLPGAGNRALFCFGQSAAAPVLTKHGLFGIDLARPHIFLVGQPAAESSFAASLQVPLDSALVGLDLGVQGVALGVPGIRLSEALAFIQVL